MNEGVRVELPDPPRTLIEPNGLIIPLICVHPVHLRLKKSKWSALPPSRPVGIPIPQHGLERRRRVADPLDEVIPDFLAFQNLHLDP
jgi:hypothetical protein